MSMSSGLSDMPGQPGYGPAQTDAGIAKGTLPPGYKVNNDGTIRGADGNTYPKGTYWDPDGNPVYPTAGARTPGPIGGALGALRGVDIPERTDVDDRYVPEDYVPKTVRGKSSVTIRNPITGEVTTQPLLDYRDPISEMDRLRGAPTEGAYSPQETVATQGPSQAAFATADPAGIAAQINAMRQTQGVYEGLGKTKAQLGDVYGDFRDIYNQGGMTAIDRARWEEAKNRNLGLARQQRESTLASMEARGLGGSGAELASILSGQQGANTNMSAESLTMNADAMKRAMESLYGASGVAQAQGGIQQAQGTMAGQLGDMGYKRADQSFNQDFDTGTAADLVNRFNTEGYRAAEATRAKGVRDAIQRDVDAENKVKQGNVDWGREVAKTDVGIQNEAGAANVTNRNKYGEYYDIEEPWRITGAKTGKAQSVADVYKGWYGIDVNAKAAKDAAAAQSDAALYGGLLSAGASVLTGGVTSLLTPK